METMTGYKPPKKSLHTEDPARLAEDLSTFYLRFNAHDFRNELDKVTSEVERLPKQKVTIKEDDVKRQFKKVNQRSASGPDGVSGRTLRECCDTLAPVYTTLFNYTWIILREELQ